MFVTKGHEHIQSFGIHNNMSVESVIEKLQRITKEKETHTEVGRGSEIVEEKKSKKRVEKSRR